MPGGGGAQDSALHDAQGALRDAVSAAQNFLVLLRSLRVGPRAITPLLSEIHSSLRMTPEALSVLLTHTRLQEEPASRALLAYLGDCVSEASRVLLSIGTSPVEARARLALETAFSRLVPRLDAVRELAELLILLEAPAVELDLTELIEATFAPSSRTGLVDPSLQLCILTPHRGAFPVKTTPRAAVRLLRLMLGFIHGGPEHGWSTPQALLRITPSDRVECVFQACSPEELRELGPRGDTVLVRVPLLIPPAVAVLSLYSARAHTRIAFEQSPLSALLAFAPP